jgi:uridylate kinase
MYHEETVVISVGGSLIVPQEIDTAFLASFKSLIEEEIAAGRRFIVIAGGGRTARKYQDAVRTISELAPEDIDWIGIHATRLNGHLLRTTFREVAYPTMITNPDEILDVPEETPLIIAAGYRPGASTDLRAVQIARHRGAQKLVNLSNIDYIYTGDPKTDQSAKAIPDITWKDFRNMIPADWDPGLSSPFDPVAARTAEAYRLEVAIINGGKLDELRKYLRSEPFVGTKIHI